MLNIHVYSQAFLAFDGAVVPFVAVQNARGQYALPWQSPASLADTGGCLASYLTLLI